MSVSIVENAISFLQQHPQATIAALSCTALLVFSRLRRKGSKLQLQGPRSESWLFGVSKYLFQAVNGSSTYVAWARTYGPIYKIPLTLGDEALVLVDPKAIATFFARDTSTYSQGSGIRAFIRRNFGENVIIAEGEDHKRHRRALSPGFSIAAIRDLTPVFLKGVYRVTDQWKQSIQANGGSHAIIEVQRWVNAITLDSIGNGGFSHDFEATNGRLSILQQRFESFGSLKPSYPAMAIFLLSGVVPFVTKIPTERSKLTKELSDSIRELAVDLFEKAQTEKEGSEEGIERSILGALVKSQSASAKIHMDVEEIMAQIGLFMIAGYETTATAISWCLTELARNPEIQQRLRDELATLNGEDPTYEQLSSGLPYLDAVICEALRLHPSVTELNRKANVDDVLPLSNPVVNDQGETMDTFPVPAGTKIRIPLGALNIHEDYWGEDSLVFNPSRWIDDGSSPKKSEQISGFRHLLTFADGPRTCLGRLFALTEFRAVLAILIRDFSFEFPQGKDTKIVMHRALTPRPKVEGQEGPFLPMLVTKL